jgi:peptidoglycan-associated lipoprotein
MSPAALRAVFGSCLTLGFADLAWLDMNAARWGTETSPPPVVLVEKAPAVELPAVMVRPAATPQPEPAPAAATASEPLPAAAPLGPTKQGDAVTSCTVQFDRSLSILHADQAANLTVIAQAVKENPRAVVRIGGHADRLAWKANRGNNLSLSEDRSLAVARALGKLGVPPDRIRRAAFGDTRPVDDRSTEDAHRRNRRVEVRVDLTGDE